MITAVVLNWQRPNVIQQVTIPILAKCPHIDELIIAHCLEDSFFDTPEGDGRLHIQHLKVFDPALGLKVRWVAAMEARNEHILSMDDDVLVSPESLSTLCESYMQEPDVIHGCFARHFQDAELKYLLGNPSYGKLALVLTPLSIQGKAIWRECLELAPQVEGILRDDLKWWDGEDIFGALVAIKRSKKLNRSHNLHFTNEVRMRTPKVRISVWKHEALRIEQRSAIIAHCADAWGLRDMLLEQQELEEPLPDSYESQPKSSRKPITKRVWSRLKRPNHSMHNPRFALSEFVPSWWKVLVQNGVSKAPFWPENTLEVCDDADTTSKPLQPHGRTGWNRRAGTLPVLLLDRTFYSHPSVPSWLRDKNVDRVILCLEDPRVAYWGVATESIAKRLEAERKAIEAGMPIPLLWLYKEERVRTILPVQVAPLEKSRCSGWGDKLPALYQNAYVFWLKQWCLEYEPEDLLILPFEAVPEEAGKIAGFLDLPKSLALEPAKKREERLVADAKVLLNDFYRPHVGALKELLQERGLWSQSWENSAWMNEIGNHE